MGVVLDWSAARSGSPAPCVDCGVLATLRDPETGRPRHKPCAEARTPDRAVARDEGAAIGPERATKRRETVKHVPGGEAFDVHRFRDLLSVWPPEPARVVQHGDTGGDSDAPAVAPPVETVVAQRPLAEGDPCPKGVHTVRKALEQAGWTVTATYAAVRQGGVDTTSVALRCGREGVRAWAVWVDGKATGGQVQGVPGTLGITAWRAATGSSPTPKAPRKRPPEQSPLPDLEAIAAGVDA